ncbi:MAG: ABC-F family ATP-binding cassette domain-containing protein, partial [Actinomycetota bacterium]
FPAPPRAGRVVLELKDITFAYGDNVIYDGLDIHLERDHKVALVGPNGAGKTTLLKLMAGVLTPAAGERSLGHNVNLGYFAQHQIEALDPRNRVVEELAAAIPPDVDARPRDLLGRFLFSGEDIDKPVRVLSGGERTRLALAKLLVQPYNVLCLDEPTNHLDMTSRDVLQEALIEYPGALVLITHDRYLIRSVADRIVEVVDGVVTSYDGDYDYYLSKRDRSVGRSEPASEPTNGEHPPSTPRKKTKEQKRIEAEARAATKHLRDRIVAIEKELDEVAAELKRLGEVLGDPNVYSSDHDVVHLSREYERAKKRTEALESSWEEATAALQEMTENA